MAAWHEPPTARPNLVAVLAGCLYFGAMLGLAGLVLYRVLSPLVSLP